MIEGHTDSKGSDNYNLYLSKARADKIKKILHVMGVENERLVPNGFGESRPLVPNSNPDGTDNPENRQQGPSFVSNGVMPVPLLARARRDAEEHPVDPI